MKQSSLKALFLFLGCSIALASVQAQCIEKDGRLVRPDGTPCESAISTAVPFLSINPTARFGAMGDVGIAVSPDPNSMHFNPSALAFADKDFSIGATYTPWLRALGLNDVFLAYVPMYKRIDDRQVVGASLRYFSLGDVQYTDNQGQQLQRVRPNELEVAGAYAIKLSDRFSASLALKYIFSNLGSGAEVNGEVLTPAHAFAADLSFSYRQPLKLADHDATLSFGLAASNLGSKISYTKSAEDQDYLPARLGIGSALEYEFDENNTITFAVDVNKLLVPTPIPDVSPDYDTDGNDIADFKEKSVPASIFGSFGDAPNGLSEEIKELMFSFGVEYWYAQQFAVRAGYFSESKTKGNRRYLTVGLGLKFNLLRLDMSYLVPTSTQRNPLDNTIRFGLAFEFSGDKDA